MTDDNDFEDEHPPESDTPDEDVPADGAPVKKPELPPEDDPVPTGGTGQGE